MTRILGAGALTLVAYLGWLGWDQRRPDESSGPYQPWQVIGLALTLTALVVVVTWRRRAQGVPAAVAVAAVLTVAWSIDAASDRTIGANLWPVGAIFLAVGSTVGLLLVFAVTVAVLAAHARWWKRIDPSGSRWWR